VQAEIDAVCELVDFLRFNVQYAGVRIYEHYWILMICIKFSNIKAFLWIAVWVMLWWICIVLHCSSLKQQSTSRHVTSTQIYYPDSEPTIAREATNSNFIVFGLSRTGFQPTIHCTRGEYPNYIVLNHWSGFSTLNTKYFFQEYP
jgi:hypothetical protein